MGPDRNVDRIISKITSGPSFSRARQKLAAYARVVRGRPKLGRRGAGALEFALVAGPLVAVMFGFLATNILFFTWSAMQDSAQYAARMMATGSVKTFANGTITLANTTSTTVCGNVASGVVEYFACQGLPGWATFTVTATENCAVPNVSVSISVNAKAAAMADIFSMFTGKTIVANSTMMKEGPCP